MRKKSDLVGKRFGRLLVMEEVSVPYERPQEKRKTIIKLKCQCDCGSIVFPFKTNVSLGKTKSCPRCQNSIDLVGKKIGSLTVIKRDLDQKKPSYLCKCDCGDEGVYQTRFLVTAKKKCCDRCRFPKKYLPNPIKKDIREHLAEINYAKHIRKKDSYVRSKRGRIKILSFSHWKKSEKRRNAYYNALCKCGNRFLIRGDSTSLSCGCLQRDSVPKGENNSRSLLTNDQAQAIREFMRSNIGYTQRELAKMFGVSEHVIFRIVRERTYKT